MRYLLDTHVWLWMCAEPEQISEKVMEIIGNSSSILLLSTASIWEIIIKTQIGKLSFPIDLASYIDSRIIETQVQVLSINLEHCLELSKLPSYHKDPFDKILIAQAKREKIIMLSADEKLVPYPIEIIWK